jgi:hypothetical protein
MFVPGEGVTLFTRSMTIETYKRAPLHDGFFRMVNPAHIDGYHAVIGRELDALHDDPLTPFRSTSYVLH